MPQMFEKEPDLQADIVVWFRTNLPVSATRFCHR
jgi:hypothetical protein